MSKKLIIALCMFAIWTPRVANSQLLDNPLGLSPGSTFSCLRGSDFRSSCNLPIMLPMFIAGVFTPQHRLPYWPLRGVMLGDILATQGPSISGGGGLIVGVSQPDPGQSNILFSCDPGLVVRAVRLPLRLEAAKNYASRQGKTALAESITADSALGFVEWLMFSNRVPGCYDDALGLVVATREHLLALVKSPTPWQLIDLWNEWLNSETPLNERRLP